MGKRRPVLTPEVQRYVRIEPFERKLDALPEVQVDLKKSHLTPREVSNQLIVESNVRTAKLGQTRKGADQLVREHLADMERKLGKFSSRQLSVTEAARIDKALKEMMGSLRTAAGELTRAEISSQAKLVVGRTQRLLKKMGMPGMTKKMADQVTARAAERTMGRFKGMTTQERLDRIVGRATRANSAQLQLAKLQGMTGTQYKELLTRNLTFKEYGQRIPGGSAMSKELDRLLISESSRAAQEATLEMAEATGIPLVRWNVSGSHADAKKRYGYKNEVCDVYATMTDPEVMALEASGNLAVGRLDMEGLWLRSNVPGYPHPNCRCWHELVISTAVVNRFNRLAGSGIDMRLLKASDLVSRVSPGVQKLMAALDGEGLALWQAMGHDQMRALVNELSEVELGLLKEKGMSRSAALKLGRLKKAARGIRRDMRQGLLDAMDSDMTERLGTFVSGALQPEIHRGMFDALNALAYELSGSPVLRYELSKTMGMEQSVRVAMRTLKARGVPAEKLRAAIESILVKKEDVIRKAMAVAQEEMDTAGLIKRQGTKGVASKTVVERSRHYLYTRASTELGQGLGSVEALTRAATMVDEVDDVLVYLRAGAKWDAPEVTERLQRLGLARSDGSPVQMGNRLYIKVKPGSVEKLALEPTRAKKALQDILVSKEWDFAPTAGRRAQLIERGFWEGDLETPARVQLVKDRPPAALRRRIMEDRAAFGANPTDPYTLEQGAARKWHAANRAGTRLEELDAALAAATTDAEKLAITNAINDELGIYVRYNTVTGKQYFVIPRHFLGEPPVDRHYMDAWMEMTQRRATRLKTAPDNKVLRGLRSNTTGSAERYVMADGTVFNLKVQQQAAVEFFEEAEGAILQLDVGVGKTLTGAAAASDLIAAGKVSRVLVIAPEAGVGQQWADEIAQFTANKGRVLESRVGKKFPVDFTRSAERFDILTRDKLVELAQDADALKQLRSNYDMVIVDEIHQLTSADLGAVPKTTEALMKLGEANAKLRYRMGLTGTALREDPTELFDMLEFIKPGFSGREPAIVRKQLFRDMFAGSGRGAGGIMHQSNALHDSMTKWFRGMADDYVYTARPDRLRPGKYFIDYFDQEALQPAVRERAKDSLRRVALTDEMRVAVRKVDEQVERAVAAELAKAEPDELVIRKLQLQKEKELQRILRQESHDGHNPLVQEVFRIADEAENATEKFVIHASDTKAAEMLEKEMVAKYGRGSVRRYGGYEALDDAAKELLGEGVTRADDMTPEMRKRVQKMRFNNDPKVRFIITNDAGSTGLNLQRSSTRTVHFDLPHSYTQLAQRNGRNFRTGQMEDVKAYYIVTDTPDDVLRVKEIQSTRTVYKELDELSALSETGLAADLKKLTDSTWLDETVGKLQDVVE